MGAFPNAAVDREGNQQGDAATCGDSLAACRERRALNRIAVCEVAALLVLLVVALALRWWRLDLMPFHYDAAEALARTRETLSLGHPPLTGIVNSLGFRNPAGLEWVFLPAALLSPDPRFAAGWGAVLVVSGVVPLWWIGRRLAGAALGWSWALLYAFLPQVVFSSRDVWAQHLLIPCGAWSLALALRALPSEAPAGTRRRGGETALVGAIALAAVATLVHLCASIWLIGLCGWFVWRWRATQRHGRVVVILLALTILALTPSLLDFVQVRLHPPTAKPPHVAKFEALAPPPKALPGRLGEAYAGLFVPLASVATLSGIETVLASGWRQSMRAIDVALLIAALAGLALLILRAGDLRRVRRGEAGRQAGRPSPTRGVVTLVPAHALVLVAWLFVAPAVAAIGVRYPNGTYFFFALPALLLLPIVSVGAFLQGLASLVRGKLERGAGLSQACSLSRRVVSGALLGVFAVLALLYSGFFVTAMKSLERARVVYGSYYTPLREQLGLAREFDRAGIGRGHLVHLGGPWFQRSYDYLLEEVLNVPMRPLAVVMEDFFLRRSQPMRRTFLERNLSRSWGTIRWDVFPSLADARRFADRFYAIPVEQAQQGATSPPE